MRRLKSMLCCGISGVSVITSLLMSVPASAQVAGPILSRIAERGQINVGYRESAVPFSYLDEQKRVAGYTIDLCNRVVDEVRKKVGRDIKVNYVPVTTANRIIQISSGAVDMECGTTTITLARLEQVDFSMPFWLTGTQIAVRKKLKITEVEGLKGKTVAVLQGSSNERALQALSQSKGLGLKFIYVKDYAEGFLSLETDRVDALAGDGTPIAVFSATKTRHPAELEVVGRLLTVDPYGVMFQRGDSDFRVLVNQVLARAFSSGAAQSLLEKNFGPVNVKIGADLAALYRAQSIPE
jgi:glutamate/aspartate transport system substrate-binding protein